MIALLWLEGPFQSWGHNSRFWRRDTLNFPTRSGILGMICAAAGKKDEQEEWLAKMRRFKQTIVAYAPANGLFFPRLEDYQTIGGGYGEGLWESMFKPKTVDGTKPGGNTGSKISLRYYLQDAAFACVLELPEDEDFESFLVNPVCAISLGRANCIPSFPVWQGKFENENAALDKALEIAKEKNRKEIFRVLEGEIDGGERMLLNDVPVSFGIYKKYDSRIVSIIHCEDCDGSPSEPMDAIED